MSKHDDEYFKTHDLALVAALVEYGESPLKLDKSNPRRVVFVFENGEELQVIVSDYWLDRLKVNPKTYFDSLKHLKTRIYSSDGSRYE